MPIERYQPNLEAWRHHFKNLHEDKPYHILKEVPCTPKEEPVIEHTIVSPTQAAVDRAAAQLRREKEDRREAPPVEVEMDTVGPTRDKEVYGRKSSRGQKRSNLRGVQQKRNGLCLKKTKSRQ